MIAHNGRWALLFIGLSLVANCSGGQAAGAHIADASTTPDPGIGAESAPDAMADDDVPPQGCMTTLVLPVNESGCRANWVCDDGRVFTYACGGVADGGALCFCIDDTGSHDPSGAAACGADAQTLLSKVPGICGWDFLLPPDGGPG